MGINKYVPGRSRNLYMAICIQDEEGGGIDPVDKESAVVLLGWDCATDDDTDCDNDEIEAAEEEEDFII